MGEAESRKNYDEERCWNSKFKVHDCPAIPEGKLPEKPHRENLKSIQDFLLSSETKDSRVKKIMEETLKAREANAVPEPAPVERQFKNISGVSEKLLAKVSF